jgi:hypothetical protein
MQDGFRVVERGDAEAGEAYDCIWRHGVENTIDKSHANYLHGIYDRCPAFNALKGAYRVKLSFPGP